MKVIALLALISLTFEILDRSYYDSLGTYRFIQNFLSVRVKIKFVRPSEDYQKSIILIETLARGNDFKRLMLVKNA